jgi:hypothetical protein
MTKPIPSFAILTKTVYDNFRVGLLGRLWGGTRVGQRMAVVAQQRQFLLNQWQIIRGHFGHAVASFPRHIGSDII